MWATQEVSRLVEVGSFQPNPFGLYNTAGNVAEWVEDCYHRTYAGAPADGSAWVSGDCEQRVLRGNWWDFKARNGRSTPNDVRSAKRAAASPSDERLTFYGFRLARTLIP